MDTVAFDGKPPANLSTMVMAFGGWIDAGRAATGALRHLVRELPAARLARIDPEEFFVLTQERPEPGHRLAGLRDHELLARLRPIQKPGQMRLCLVHIDCFHGGLRLVHP